MSRQLVLHSTMYSDGENKCLQPTSIAANHCVTLVTLCEFRKKLNSLLKRIMLTWLTLTLSLLFVKHCRFKVTWKNNVEYHGTKRRLRRVTIPCT